MIHNSYVRGVTDSSTMERRYEVHNKSGSVYVKVKYLCHASLQPVWGRFSLATWPTIYNPHNMNFILGPVWSQKLSQLSRQFWPHCNFLNTWNHWNFDFYVAWNIWAEWKWNKSNVLLSLWLIQSVLRDAPPQKWDRSWLLPSKMREKPHLWSCFWSSSPWFAFQHRLGLLLQQSNVDCWNKLW